jgi:serine/threonine protein kinase
MARQDRLGRMVAMKLVPEWPPPTDVSLERFNRAAYVCAHTPHPGLATLFDVGTRDGFYYATYTFLEGQTLQRHLGTVGQVDEGFAIKSAIYICRTLAALHGNNICHRNVKPKNLFLENNGNVRIIGLGLASCKTAFFSPHLDTHAIGTPHFMAPEMIKGACADPRSDLYSLGVTLYVMVAGRPPYDRGIPAVVMSRHLTDTPASLKELRPDLSSKFVGLIEGLMVKDPSKRIQSAAEAAALFEGLGKKNSSFWKLSPLLKPAAAAPAPALPIAPAAPADNGHGAMARVEPKQPTPLMIPQANHPLAFLWNTKFKLSDPIVVSMLAAIAVVAMLLGSLYAATGLIGKRSPAVQPRVQRAQIPVVLEAPQPQFDPRQQREFDHLLGLSNQFQDDPTAGSAAWADFIEKHPHMTREVQTVAGQRFELYQRLKERSRVDIRPRADEPEF